MNSFSHHIRRTLVLGLPLVGSHLAQMALHVTDTIMLGWYSVEALAAVVIAASVFFCLFILGSGFAISVMGLIAAALGQGAEAELRRLARMSLWLSLGFSALIYPLFWVSGPVLIALGQEPQVAALAQDYLRIAGLGMAPALVVMVLKSVLAAAERTQVVLWVTLAAVGLNAGINYGLIFGAWGLPELGVQGAALASVLTQCASALVLGLYAGARGPLARFHLWQRFWRPDWAALKRVFWLGAPVGLTGLSEAALFQASALMMGWFGTAPLAAHGIALEITALSFMVHVGLSNAVTVRVGNALGRADALGLRRAAQAALVLSALFAAAMITLFLTLPEPLVALFLDASDPQTPQIIALGALLLGVAALFQTTDAMQVMALGLLRGVHDTHVAMWITGISYWLIGVPASYVLAFKLGLGPAGIWYGLVIGLTVAGVSLMTRFWRGMGRWIAPSL